MYMCEFLSVRQFAQSSATRHLQTLPSIHFWRSSKEFIKDMDRQRQ